VASLLVPVNNEDMLPAIIRSVRDVTTIWTEDDAPALRPNVAMPWKLLP
jgi:hypothetical protein